MSSEYEKQLKDLRREVEDLREALARHSASFNPVLKALCDEAGIVYTNALDAENALVDRLRASR